VNTASETFIVYVILYRLEHGRQFYVRIWGMSRFVFFVVLVAHCQKYVEMVHAN